MTYMNARSNLRNYVGQLRLYSYVDLVLLLMAGGAQSVRAFCGASLLWFAFLMYLETIHQDQGRLRWPRYAWVVVVLPGIMLLPDIRVIGYTTCAALYAEKKRRPRVAAVSFIVNGSLKTVLVALAGSVSLRMGLTVLVATAVRNLAGDLRDVAKDRIEDVRTLPVRLGVRRGRPSAYPLCLAATTALWVVIGPAPSVVLPAAWAIEAATYRLTPR
jgi:1,4-dihydroxy-2-naphthoate octaprenyltransferase